MSQRHSLAAIRCRSVQSTAERSILIALAEQANDEGLGVLDWDEISESAGLPKAYVVEVVSRLTKQTIIVNGPAGDFYTLNLPL